MVLTIKLIRLQLVALCEKERCRTGPHTPTEVKGGA